MDPKKKPESFFRLMLNKTRDSSYSRYSINQEPRKILLLPLPLPSEALGLPFYLFISFEIALC